MQYWGMTLSFIFSSMSDFALRADLKEMTLINHRLANRLKARLKNNQLLRGAGKATIINVGVSREDCFDVA